MEFPYTFFEDEVREGFYISGSMKRIWASQIEVLSEVAKVCEKHNIKWFADCGTLLGAVRHGGYIPWDDDLDICMLRDDYVKFNKVAKDELPEHYEVINMHGEEDFFEYITRVANGHRLDFGKEYIEKYHECPYATGIDIFPLDYLSPNEKEEEERRALADLLMKASDTYGEKDIEKDDMDNVLHEIEKLCNKKIDTTKSIRRQLYEMTEAVFTMFDSRNATHVALMHFWVPNHNHKYNIKHFSKRVMMPFECASVPVPYAYDAVLKVEYGNYMTISKGGGIHNFPYFEGQEEHLIEHLKEHGEEYPFKYKLKHEHMVNEERKKYDKPRKQAKDFVELMGKAHDAIVAMVMMGNYNQVSDILVSCQNGAIQIGNLLEERYGEGFITVKHLEEYCEIIYQIGQLNEQAMETDQFGLSPEDLKGYLTEIEAVINNSIENDIPDKYEVLFLSVKANAWGSLDNVWRSMIDNPNYEVTVMPIPYYERKAMGSMGEEHYEGSLFPQYLNIVDYKEYDLIKTHPDEIIIQNPYDSCNYTTTIMPEYYSANIKMHTEKLTYIPWFKLDEMGENDKKAKKVMQYYCAMPGVVNADSVIVQSEQTRKAYIEYLTDFAGEDTRDIWSKKITVSDIDIYGEKSVELVEYEKEKAFEVLPKQWIDKMMSSLGKRKKLILYNTTVAAYAASPREFLDKVKDNIKTFAKYKDSIFVIWQINEELTKIMEMENRKLAKEFKEIIESFRIQELGVINEELDYEQLINVCDAYYGDNCCVAHLCQLKGMPVMIQYIKN